MYRFEFSKSKVMKAVGLCLCLGALASCQNNDSFQAFRRSEGSFQVAEQPVFAYPIAKEGQAEAVQKPYRAFELPKNEVVTLDLKPKAPPVKIKELESIFPASNGHSGIRSEVPKRAAPNIANDRDVQYILKELGFYRGELDGKMGPITKKAVVAFQASRKLKADGVVGSKTKQHLAKAMIEKHEKVFDSIQ
jgi:hypothetical protein